MQQDCTTPPSKGPLTLKQINERHRQFWDEQSKLMAQRISDETIFSLATIDMRSEGARGVSLRSQKTFEQALADAENAKNTVQRGFSRRGGRSPKSDALQDLIREIVDEHPGITEGQLLRLLNSERGAGTVTSIDDEAEALAGVREIHFVEEDGTPKTAPLSGVKDRLSRTKRTNGIALTG